MDEPVTKLLVPHARATQHLVASLSNRRSHRMDKTLVVYFSRTGYTRRLAEEIAARCDADLESIQEAQRRSGVLGYWRSAREALGRTAVDIRALEKDPARYELVILGTPVWAGHVSSPMRAYLATNRAKLRQVAFFGTEGGSGAEKVFREMAELCGVAPTASEVFTDGEIDKHRYSAKLAAFVSAIRKPQDRSNVATAPDDSRETRPAG